MLHLESPRQTGDMPLGQGFEASKCTALTGVGVCLQGCARAHWPTSPCQGSMFLFQFSSEVWWGEEWEGEGCFCDLTEKQIKPARNECPKELGHTQGKRAPASR